MGAHSAQTPTLGIHGAIAYVAADEAARLALGPFVTADRFKLCFQEDTKAIYMLTNTAGPTWLEVGGGGGGGGTPGLVPTSTKNANYTAQPGEAVLVTMSGGLSFTVTLANGTTPGDLVAVVAVGFSVGEAVQVDGAIGTYLPPYGVSQELPCITYIWDGSGWFVLSTGTGWDTIA